MKTSFRILALTLFLLAFSAAAFAQSEWIGSYVFEENVGKTVGGTPILAVHQIDVSEGDDGLIANISSTGYQTSASLICSARVVGPKLEIRFLSYGEDNLFEPYEEGDLLLTLEAKNVKNKPVLLTTWGKFTPLRESSKKPAQVYFQRIVVRSE
jgi:hypothetical protein